jgi:putative PIN family toxin of toxin-antitoxin system
VTRAVIDTNLVVSGILNPSGSPGAVLRTAGVRFELVWTPAIVVECYRVLSYPRLKKFLGARAEAARQVVADLAALAVLVPPGQLPLVRVVEADPDDDVLFGTALAGAATFVVSGDAAVLAVGSFAGVMVVSAAEFLASLGEH